MKPLILFVDDEVIILNSLRNQLKDELKVEFHLEFTESAEEALEILEEFDDEETPSTIITDWVMPGMSGKDFIREIHKNFPKVRKMVLTGQANKEDLKFAMDELDVFRCMKKPWDKEEIIKAIKSPNKAFDTKKTIILCVDDEPMILKTLKNQLTNFFGSKFSILTALSGPEALELIEDLKEDDMLPHIIISDQMMPDMPGDEFLSITKEEHPEIIRILLTGEASHENIVNAINNAGLYRFIDKPWNVDDLNLTVKEGIDSFNKTDHLKDERKRVVDLYLSLEERVTQRTRQLVSQKNTIEEQNNSIKSSLSYAQRIQNAILPSLKTIQEGFKDAFVIYRPKDVVSGDFYMYWDYAPNISYVATIDCTGHGVPGAFLTIMGKFILEIINSNGNGPPPNEILSVLNNKLITTLHGDMPKNGKMINDGMDIALCKIDKKEQVIEFSGANHSLYHCSESGLNYVKGDRKGIGFSPFDDANENKKFELITFKYNSGEKIFMFSDGYTDQFGGVYQKKYTRKRLHNLLLNSNHRSLQEQKEILIKEHIDWKQEISQTDDIVGIGIELH